jgi:hypothetical protein
MSINPRVVFFEFLSFREVVDVFVDVLFLRFAKGLL